MAAERCSWDRWLVATGAAVAWLFVLGLQWVAIDRQSLVGDAPYHLLAGDQALRSGQNQLNLEHPPLVKLLAAWPLLDEEPLSPPVAMDRAIDTSRRLFADPKRTRRAQLRARSVLLLAFGLPFLGGCTLLGSRFGGRRTGGILALTLGLSFSVLPFLPVIQTDAAVALGFVLTLVASLVYLDRPAPLTALAVGGGLGLAVAAKYSGLLLLPTVLLAILFADRTPQVTRAGRRRAAQLRDFVLIGLAACGLLYSTYSIANRHYDPNIGRDTIERYVHGEGMITGDSMERYAELLFSVERFDPNLAQWLTGFLGIRSQDAAGVYPSYAFGNLTSQGRWWYFPALFLIQTPIAVLVALLGGLSLLSTKAERRDGADAPRPGEQRWRRPLSGDKSVVLVVVTAAVYLGVAMTSNYNLGFRHLLPILPVLYLPAACWTAKRRWRSFLLVGALVVEATTLAPLWMSSTNTWWMGPWNPTRLSLGSLEYHQSFLALADYAKANGIEPLGVLYPLLHPTELEAYLPDARLLEPQTSLRPGGWYAVNVLVEQYLPAVERSSAATLRGHRNFVALADTWTPLWRAIARGEDHGYVAGTFHLYRLPEEPQSVSRSLP